MAGLAGHGAAEGLVPREVHHGWLSPAERQVADERVAGHGVVLNGEHHASEPEVPGNESGAGSGYA